MPNCFTADTVSPPPAIENAPSSVAAAMEAARTFVPPANGSISKTPTGPFQTIVFAARTSRSSSSRDFADIENHLVICHIAHAADTERTLGRERLRDDDIHRKRHRGVLFFKRLQNAEAFRNEIGLSERLADREPFARRNVFAMPPPTTRRSTVEARRFRIVSFVETLEPATIAISG